VEEHNRSAPVMATGNGDARRGNREWCRSADKTTPSKTFWTFADENPYLFDNEWNCHS
jgi:hypothetical protein